MSTSARFHLSAALSVTTGRLLCDLDDMYKIVSHIIGRPAYTHDLATGTCSRAVLAQHPGLPSSVPDGFGADDVQPFVEEAIRAFGASEVDIAPADGKVADVFTSLATAMR